MMGQVQPDTGRSKRIRVLTGVKPTGNIHLGNYISAIAPAVELSRSPDHYVVLMCVDWHGMSDKAHILEPGRVSRQVIATFLALGFNVQQNSLILQSDFPEIPELAWSLSCVSPVGLLQRGHAYKDSVANGKEPAVGLFYYPVLMAADILTFDAEMIPVGKDQVQHLEFTSDMAKALNHALGTEVFKEPKPILQEIPVLVGTDGRKMSKSYNNAIPLFAPKKEIERLIKGIVTDSKGVDEPKDPEECYVYQIMRTFGRPEAVADMRDKLTAGKSYGYGHAKKALIEEHEYAFGRHREAYDHFLASDVEVRSLLREGYDRAREMAQQTRKRAREALGLSSFR